MRPAASRTLKGDPVLSSVPAFRGIPASPCGLDTCEGRDYRGVPCLNQKQWTEAESLYRQALALAESEHDEYKRAHCQMLLGHLLWYKSAYPEALAWLEKARTAFEQSGDRHAVSRAIGRSDWRASMYPPIVPTTTMIPKNSRPVLNR